MFLFYILLHVAAISAQTYNVMDFGAKGDGTTKDTGAIVKAVQACELSGHCNLVFPPGRYLTAPFNLTSNVNMIIQKGATILGSTDRSDWPIIPPLPSYCQGREFPGPRYTSLIHGEHIDNVTITGGGAIDGQGHVWWDWLHNKQINNTRGRLVEIMYCNGLYINDITLRNPPFWTLHPYDCENVIIHHVTIDNPADSPNTDGIDPDSCRNVHIYNCSISAGDDNIAIKSGIDWCGRNYNKSSENILIENCQFGSGHGISIGSEMSGGVRNVTIRDSHAKGTQRGCRVKTGRGRGGIVQDITFENITFDDVGMAVNVDMFYTDLPPTNATGTPIFKNINMIGLSGATSSPGGYNCLPESPCHNMILEHVSLKTQGQFNCSYAQGTSTDVSPKSCL